MKTLNLLLVCCSLGTTALATAVEAGAGQAGAFQAGGAANVNFSVSITDGSLSESISRLAVYTRQPSDGTLLSSVARNLSIFRSESAGNLSESLVRFSVYTRSASDGSLDEIPARSLALSRLTTDGVLSETTTRAGAFTRLPSDTGFMSVAVFNGHAFSATPVVTALFSEGVNRLSTYSRALVDNSVSLASSRILNYSRSSNAITTIAPNISVITRSGTVLPRYFVTYQPPVRSIVVKK